MTLAAEALAVALIGGFPIWAFVAVKTADRLRHRHESPDQRALRVLREQAAEREWWSA